MSFQPQHVLAAVAVGPDDDFALAEKVVDAATDLLRGPARRLTLVYVHAARGLIAGADNGFAPPSYYEAMGRLWEEGRAAGERALERLRARAAAKGVEVAAQVIEGVEGTGDTIASAAEAAGADAIAVCSHGRRGLKRVVLGSVAARVALVAQVPVLILR